MKKINLKINISLNIDGLSETELDKISAFFRVNVEAGCLDNQKVIDLLQLDKRPILVTHAGRRKISEGFDSATIDLVC